MSDADARRSTPGYVYGTAMRCTGQRVEATPPCSCPCHVADVPSDARGWSCNRCYSMTLFSSYPERPRVEYSHEQAIADGTTNPQPYMVPEIDYYFITKGNTLDDEVGEHFDSKEDAEARKEELNAADAIASLKVPRTHRARFDRYRKLYRFGWWSYSPDRHPLTTLPRKPGRYAVEDYYEGDSSWSHHESLDDVRELIEGGDVLRVVDLDTGKDVSFTRSVKVEIA